MKRNTTCLFITLFLISSSLSAQNQISVDFNVDMNEILGSTGERKLNVGLSGNVEPLTWQNIAPMEDPDGDGIYTTQITFKEVNQKDTLHFKFRLNEVEWETGENRVYPLLSKEDIKSSFRYEPLPDNPFARFIGQWKLKNDDWRNGTTDQVDSIKWYNHISRCEQLYTVGSLLWSVEAGSLKGNILWTYNFDRQEMVQSSSYTPMSTSLGKGRVDEEGNITGLKVHFNGDNNDYRVYSYTWISDDEYFLQARFFENDEPTGQFYEGSFVRVRN